MTTSADIVAFTAVNGLAGKHRWLDAFGVFCARWLIVAMYLGTAVWALALSYGGQAAHAEAVATAAFRGAGAAAFGFIASAFASPFLFRPRPFMSILGAQRLMGDPATAHSFPSSHATAAFALAFAVLAVDRVLGGALFAVAMLVGFGRVFVGVHYPSDVLGGAVLGFGMSWAVMCVSGRGV